MKSTDLSAFITFERDQWSALSASSTLPLSAADVDRLASIGDPTGADEATAVYLPLSELMQMYARSTEVLFSNAKRFLGFDDVRVPWIVGIGGSVSVGKSTAARLLQELLSRWPETSRVSLVTTDGFLYPNAVLEERRLMQRKGFPESYDRRALLEFLAAVKSGKRNIHVPVYDHLTYDIVAGEYITVDQPDILIVEGLNVLQPSERSDADEFSVVSDFFDFSVYLDAPEDALEEWYIDRFLTLRSTAFANDRSYFRHYADMPDEVAVATARQIWESINLPNLRHNIAPTRSRATVILTKGHDHAVEKVQVRKL